MRKWLSFRKFRAGRWHLFGVIPLVIPMVLGVHLEYSSDTTFPLFYRGVLNGVVVRTTYMYELYWGEFFARAYAWRSDFPFHGLTLILFSALAVLLSFLPVLRLNHTIQPPVLWMLVLMTGLSGLLLVHVSWLDFTRIPLLMVAAISLLLLNAGSGMLAPVVLVILWVSAYWLRPESGQVAFIMILPSLVLALYADFKKYRRAVLWVFLGIVMALGSSKAHKILYQSEEANTMRTMYDLHFAFFDAYHRNEEMAKSSPANAARYEAMLVDFQSDKDSLSLEHYASFVDGRAFSPDALRQLPERLMRLGDLFRQLSSLGKGMMLLYLSVVFCCILMLDSRRKVLWLLLHQAYCWACILAIVFFVKTAERTYEPMITVAALIALADLRRVYTKYHPFILKMAMYPLFVIFLYGGFHWWNTYSGKSAWYKEMAVRNHQVLTQITDFQREQGNVLLSVDALELFNIRPMNEWNGSDIFYMHDAHINYFPGMDEALAENFGSPSLRQFYGAAADSNMLLISSEKRMAVIQNYLKRVHDLDIQCNIVRSFPVLKVSGERDCFHIYRLGKSFGNL